MVKRRKSGNEGLATLIGITSMLLLLAGCCIWFLGGTSPPGLSVGGPWTLTRDDGQVAHDSDFRGRFLLIYFGYASCPDVCPTTLSAVAGAMHQLGPQAGRLQPLFISVDPQHDTPSVLRHYVQAFGPNLIGLTGTPAEIRAVQQEYRIGSVVHHLDGDITSIDHTSVLLLVGPDGHYLAPLPADQSAAEIAARLAPYLS